ncbi:uncharacterized protein LOC120749537 [Hirundo rustica]|uniref:uncharacterized protein LOC120749537 n=1 Tax=Hirundo rustica TaxID=43150 RepID=UPI001A93EE9B|nr:uncharacterized protein LOC120749537 [Hirundo rustica]XP_039912970.1 uncharacterized protein LOC120749537 [Hirundo rustica]
MIKLVILFCILPQPHGQIPAELPWSGATIRYTGVLGSYPTDHHSNLATVVLHDSKIYRPSEWRWDREDWIRTLTGTIGEIIMVACRKVEGSLYEKASTITIAGNFLEPDGKNYLHIPTAELCPTTKWKCAKQIPLVLCCRQEYVGNYTLSPRTNNIAITKDCKNESTDCWYSFTLAKPTYVTCLWLNNSTDPLGLKGLIHKFKINTIPKPTLSRVVTPQRVEGTESTLSQYDTEWPWSQAFVHFTGSMGNVKDLNLSTVVMHENQIYTRQEWEKQKTWQLQGVVGEKISIGCRMINGTTHRKATSISVLTNQTNKHEKACMHPSVQDCWHNFTLAQTVEVVCLWSKNTKGLSFKFKINAIAQSVKH